MTIVGGGLILPIGGKSMDVDWLKYQKLKCDWSMKSIIPSDLPDDFCDESCRLVDEFRRKTVNVDVEWMLYFDYMTGEVIYCWEGEGGTSGGDFDRIHFQGRNVASIHSHPKGYYSFPLPNNFDILENEFGDFEIIVSVGVIWIVGFNGCVEKEVRQKFQFCIGKDMDKIYHKVKSKFDDENIVNSW